jgi:phosphonate transport system substrate-binding protein
MKWLDSLLTARVSSGAQGFFGSISEATKATQVVMPVFFGQADACLVNRSLLETMSELNPQVGRQLLILEQSPGFVTGILAARKNFSHTQRDTVVKILQEMHTDPKGKQIMSLFRITRLVPFMPEHLASVEKVLRVRQGRTDSVAGRKQ